MSARLGYKVRQRKSRSARAGLLFPVGRIHRLCRKEMPGLSRYRNIAFIVLILVYHLVHQDGQARPGLPHGRSWVPHRRGVGAGWAHLQASKARQSDAPKHPTRHKGGQRWNCLPIHFITISYQNLTSWSPMPSSLTPGEERGRKSARRLPWSSGASHRKRSTPTTPWGRVPSLAKERRRKLSRMSTARKRKITSSQQTHAIKGNPTNLQEDQRRRNAIGRRTNQSNLVEKEEREAKCFLKSWTE